MTEAAPPRRRSILLIVSLCLNIVLIPVIGAVVVRAMHRDTSIGTGGILAPRSVMAALPETRVAIQTVIDTHSAKIRALRLAAVRARRAAFEALAAPAYSRQTFARALEGVRDADGALETESIAMMADSLAVLTPAERQAMVDRVKRRNQSWLFRMFRPRAMRQ